MPVNRVSAQLGEAERQAVFAATQTIRRRLLFPKDLTSEERRSLTRFGGEGRGFVEQALQGAEFGETIDLSGRVMRGVRRLPRMR